MRHYFLLFIFLLTLSSCDKKQESFHLNGNLKSTVKMLNEKKQGVEKSYYPNGALESEITYEAGLKEGPAVEYYETGSMKAKYAHESNLIEGDLTRYHENGQIAYHALFSKNKPATFPEEFDEKGAPLTKGVYADFRDQNEYEWVRIGSSVWLAQNMDYATEKGSLCMQCTAWGRLYDFNAIKEACPNGFHVPSEAEWKELLLFTGDKPGQKLKATFGWDPIGLTGVYGNGDNTLGFQVKGGGAHFASSDLKLGQRKFDFAGKRAFLWTAEGTVIVFHYENDKVLFQKWNPEHGASLRCIKSKP